MPAGSGKNDPVPDGVINSKEPLTPKGEQENP